MNNSNKTLNEIVAENHVMASVLYYFGIRFYEHSDQTLAEVCHQMGITVDRVEKEFEAVQQNDSVDELRLLTYPVPLIIEYLKHGHFLFAKQRLPFIARMIDGLNENDFENKALVKDLKFVFPLFVEDFIKHMYEEEDQLFTFILKLEEIIKGNRPLSGIYYQLEQHFLQHYAVEHHHSDTELAGIRGFTNEYEASAFDSVHLSVIYFELKQFDQEVQQHAAIENKVLLPKALLMEKQVRQQITLNQRFN